MIEQILRRDRSDETKRTITITGVKGHRTWKYKVSNELLSLLMQLPKTSDKVLSYKDPKYMNDSLRRYRKRD